MSGSSLPLSPWIDDFDITGSLLSDSFQQQEQQIPPDFGPYTPDLSIEYGGSGYIAPSSSPTQQGTSFQPPSPSQQTPTFSAPESSTIATMSLSHHPRPQTSSTPTAFPPLSIRSRYGLAPSPSPYGGTPSTTIPPSPIPTSRASQFNRHRHHNHDQNPAPNPYHAPDRSPYGFPSLPPSTLDPQPLREPHFPPSNPPPPTNHIEETLQSTNTKVDEELSHKMSHVHLRLEHERESERKRKHDENAKAIAAISAKHRRNHLRRIMSEKREQRRARMTPETIKAATNRSEKDKEAKKKREESLSRRHAMAVRQCQERWPTLAAELRSQREQGVARRRALVALSRGARGREGGQGDAQGRGGDEEMLNVETAAPGVAMDTAPLAAPRDAEQEDSWSMGALSPEEQRCSCNDKGMGSLFSREDHCSCNDESMEY